jgi:hypothetical protein
MPKLPLVYNEMEPNQDTRYKIVEIVGTRLRYKETLLSTIKGPLARTLIEAHLRQEELAWDYDVENQKIYIYRSELLGGVLESAPSDENQKENQAKK